MEFAITVEFTATEPLIASKENETEQVGKEVENLTTAKARVPVKEAGIGKKVPVVGMPVKAAVKDGGKVRVMFTGLDIMKMVEIGWKVMMKHRHGL